MEFDDPNTTNHPDVMPVTHKPGLYVMNDSNLISDTRPTLTNEEATLVIYGGQQNTGGYSLTLDGITKSSDATTINATFNGPPPDSMLTQALTYPTLLIPFRADPGTHSIELNWDHPNSARRSLTITVTE